LQAAAAVLKAYPSRGSLNLQLSVNKQLVTSLISGIDRIVAQEYVIDTIHYFDGDNNELARRLGIGELLSLRIYQPASGGVTCISVAVQVLALQHIRSACMLSLSDSPCLHVGMAGCAMHTHCCFLLVLQQLDTAHASKLTAVDCSSSIP